MAAARALRLTLLIGAVMTVAPLASPAQPAQADKAQGQQCFFVGNVDGFSAPDEHTVYVEAGVHDVWRLDLVRDCSGITFREGIGLERTPGDPWICSPIEATVVYSDHGFHQRCPVKAIHKLSPAEFSALPKRDRP